LVQVLGEVGGGEVRSFGGATEASYFADAAPVVVFGPGRLADDDGPVAHSTREYVSLTAVEEAAEIVRETIERIC
jgi:acetylornithine deacetylase/succinyl-diaminopimelate desuccinylase-like protein